VLLVGLSPFITALWDSFFHDIYGDRSFAGLENFRTITRDRGFHYSLNITVLWALLSVCLSLTAGFLLALQMAGNSRWSSFLYRILLIPWGIPVYIAVPLWRAFLHGNGGQSVISRFTGVTFNLMTDPAAGFCGALLVSLWMGIPLTTFVFVSQMRRIPKQVLEAARMDGAGEGQIALHIHLPLIRTSLLAMGVLSFIKAFKEFTLVFLMTAGGPPLVQGITERHIIGATTTLGVFLYEVFLETADGGINAAYAVMMSAVVFLIMGVWILIRKKTALRPLILLVFLAQLPGMAQTVSPAVLIPAAACLISLIKPSLYPAAFLIHLTAAAGQTAALGFLEGFDPSLVLGIPPLLLGLKNRSSRQSRKIRVIRAVPVISASRVSAGLFVFFTLAIGYLLIWMSFSRRSACYMHSWLPPFPTAGNFIALIKEEKIIRYFGNTLFLAGSVGLLLPAFTFPAAAWLTHQPKQKTLFVLGGIQILGIAGGMHSLIPLYTVFRLLGWINTFAPLILISLFHGIPFTLFTLTAYLEGLPRSFFDQARMEGMGRLRYAYRILLPLSLPPLLTAVMVAFVGAWNSFLTPLLFLNDEALYPISLKLYSYVGALGSGTPVWNLFAAASVLNTLLVALLLIRFKNPMSHSPMEESLD